MSDHDGGGADAFAEAVEPGRLDGGPGAAAPGRVLERGEQLSVQVVELGGRLADRACGEPGRRRGPTAPATRPVRVSGSAAPGRGRGGGGEVH
ncbi:hypothetical protein M1M07_10490 [Rhodococcus sp. HM1]|uniref:hypothetical protein n=1 Tax=Rhodococcus sp. HM1 TaxID=2937759 RepID=UPI00200ABF1B|nr:hypothetical protein [Rhodococcus sp. HM1]MCK8671545.1 hypothetical protein [Rhodococcus sp. HM1]